MRLEELDALITTETAEIIALNHTKGMEYASKDEALSFPKRGAELDVSPLIVWAVSAGKHWEAIINYCRTGEVLSEPIESRIRDLTFYSLLLLALVKDMQAAEVIASIDNDSDMDD
jgi:hypothetical protein